MHFSVIGEHRDFFRKHHWIECEGILDRNHLAQLSNGIDAVLNERTKQPANILTADQLYEFGHDLWRGMKSVKKVVMQKELAEIASELIEYKPLRLGYDQLLPSLKSSILPSEAYKEFLNNTPTLQEISSIQGVVCGVIICLKDVQVDELESNTERMFPFIGGNATFFSPDVPMPLPLLKNVSGATYLLIVYVRSNAVYMKQDKDLHVHAFKKLGYNFGDRLLDSLNPLVYK